jgi:biofilm PGA synthesis N-glycosyltransferase PgaC
MTWVVFAFLYRFLSGFRRTACAPRRRIVVLVPAHNEEKTVAATLASLHHQTHRPDRVIVVCDNCTDRTREVAEENGADTLMTTGNRGMRAGALNQALARILPTLSDDDLVFALDADTVAEPDAVANGARHLSDPRIAAVGAIHSALAPRRLVEWLQSMEFERDRRSTGRKKGRTGCMSGMGAMFRADALRAVARKHGSVYDEANWTEDWKLTFALRHLGYRCLRPQDFRVQTIVAPHWKSLFAQRERWGRGYFQTLTEFGLTRYTLSGWFGQAWMLLFTSVWVLWAVLMAEVVATGNLRIYWWTAAATAIFVTERVVTTWGAGIRARLLAAALFVEMAYAWWVFSATITGIGKQILGVSGRWGNVRTT